MFGGIHFNRRKFAKDFSRFEVRILLCSDQVHFYYFSNLQVNNLFQTRKKDIDDSSLVEIAIPEAEEEEPVAVSVKKRKRKTEVSGK